MSESLPILIVGAGVAGPTLTLSLHQKGYKVILFEKYDAPSQTGSSLMLAPNGLRVLDALGLAESLFTRNIATPVETFIFKTDAELLVASKIPSILREKYGFPFAGVKRSVFLKYLIEAVQAQGIELRFGYSLTAIQHADDSVTAVFDNGQTIKGSVVIGCDGLHSQARIALFGDEVAAYTGLTQTAGMTRVARRVRHLQNVYGDNIHLVSYATGVQALDDPASGTHGDTTLVSWAFTRPEQEARESWRAETGDEFRTNVACHLQWDWDDGISAPELVRGAEEIIKFGLYDRKELSTWHKGRAVLIGDAAHPTAPHLGQGANQALEDVFHLGALLTSHIPPSSFADGRSPPTDLVTKAFDELDARRIPRTSTLVRGARITGQQRVLSSKSTEAEERNQKTRADWSEEEEKILERYRILLGPTRDEP